MPAPTGHCELCDLPLAYCEHGRPALEPAAPEHRKDQVRASDGPRRRPSSTPRRSASPDASSSRAASGAAGQRPSRNRSGVTTRSVGRRRTPPEEFRPVVLAVLAEADSELDQDEALAALEQRVADDLRTGDRETTPQGEPRWQHAARRARQGLIADGLLVQGGAGVWALTEEGRQAAPGQPGPAAAPPAGD